MPFDPTPRPTRRRTRRGAFRAAVLLAFFVAAGGLATWPASAQEVLNRVVIRVNDRIATLYDFERRVADLTQQLAAAEMPLAERLQRIGQVPQQVFQEMFQELLLLSRADQAGIVFTEEEMEQQKRRMMENFGIRTEDEFRQALQAQNLDERGFREQLETGMRIQDLIGREVRGQLAVGEELARQYYRDNPEQFITPQRLNLRDLVVLEESGLDAGERLARAEEIRQRRLAGEELDALVEEGVTSGVIDLGWVNARELADELEAAVWDLEPGQVAEPVDGRGGVHVLEVVDRQEEGLRSFNEVAEQAENLAGGIAFQEAMEEYVERLERDSYVVLEPPPSAEGFRRLGTDALTVPGSAAAATPASTEEALEEEVADAAPRPLTDLEEEGAQPLPDGATAAGAPDLAYDPLGQNPSPADPPLPDYDNDDSDDGNR